MTVNRKLMLFSVALALSGCGTFDENVAPETGSMAGAATGAAIGAVASGGILAPALGAVGGAVVGEELADNTPILAEGERNRAPLALGEREPIGAGVERERGPLVVGAAEERAAVGGATAAGFDQALSPQLVRKVQQQLNAMGYDAGPVDGIWGPLTERAVRNFQQAKPDLEATGNLTRETLAALGITGGEGGAAAGGTAGGGATAKEKEKEKEKEVEKEKEAEKEKEKEVEKQR